MRENERSLGRWGFSCHWKTHSVLNNGIIKNCHLCKVQSLLCISLVHVPVNLHNCILLEMHLLLLPASSHLSVHYCHVWEGFRHARCVVSPAWRPFQIQTFARVSIKAIDLPYDSKKLTAEKQSFWEKSSERMLAWSWRKKTWLISFSPPSLREKK